MRRSEWELWGKNKEKEPLDVKSERENKNV